MESSSAKSIAVALIIGYGSPTFGIDAVATKRPLSALGKQKLAIVWTSERPEEDQQEDQEEGAAESLATMCRLFGTYLQSGKNRWAPFSKVTCRDSSSADWRLIMSRTKAQVEVELWRQRYGKKRMLDSFTLPTAVKTLETLSDEFMVYLLSVWVKDLLPFAFQVDRSKLARNTDLIKDKIHLYSKAYSIPYPPERLVVYRGEAIKKDGFYLGYPVGTADLQEDIDSLQPEEEPSKGKGKSKKDKNTQPIKDISWRLQFTDPSQNKGRILWAQNSKGSSVINSEVKQVISNYYTDRSDEDQEELLTKLSDSLTDLFVGTIKVGYFGVRYGFPVLQSDTSLFVNEMRFFGFLAEFRSGLLKGFTFHLDLWPQILEESGTEQPAEFGGHRFIFGYKFIFNIDYFVSNLHITPKIGGWTFKTSLPVGTEEDGNRELIVFETSNDLSLGLSGGLEFVDREFMIDLWVSRTVSIPSTSSEIPDASSVATSNFGVDGYYSLGSFDLFGVRMIPSALLFSFFEETTLSKTSTASTETSESSDVRSIRFEQAFYGLGLAVSW